MKLELEAEDVSADAGDLPSTCDAAVRRFVERMRERARRGRVGWRIALFMEDTAGWRTIDVDADGQNDRDADVIWAANRMARILDVPVAAFVDDGAELGMVIHIERRGEAEVETLIIGRGDAPVERMRTKDAFWLVPGGNDPAAWGRRDHDSIQRDPDLLDHEQPSTEHAVVAVLSHVATTAPSRSDDQLQYFLLTQHSDCVRIITVEVGSWSDFDEVAVDALAGLAHGLFIDVAMAVEAVEAGLVVHVQYRDGRNGVRYLLRFDERGWASAFEVAVSDQPFDIVPGSSGSGGRAAAIWAERDEERTRRSERTARTVSFARSSSGVAGGEP